MKFAIFFNDFNEKYWDALFPQKYINGWVQDCSNSIGVTAVLH